MDEIEEFAKAISEGSPLDAIGRQVAICRKSWHIEDEPVHLPKEDYLRSSSPISGTPVWEESDLSMRRRLNEYQKSVNQ
jgi:hypothetical protein